MCQAPGATRPAPSFLGPGAKRLGVYADGSCLWHCVVAAKRGGLQPRAAGLKLRLLTAEAATEEKYKRAWKLFGGHRSPPFSYDQFKKKMETFGEYSDIVTIPYMMVELGVNIVFVTDTGFYCGMPYFGNDRTLLVYWQKETKHFEPIGIPGGFDFDAIKDAYHRGSFNRRSA